jgi:hypothetical protein
VPVHSIVVVQFVLVVVGLMLGACSGTPDFEPGPADAADAATDACEAGTGTPCSPRSDASSDAATGDAAARADAQLEHDSGTDAGTGSGLDASQDGGAEVDASDDDSGEVDGGGQNVVVRSDCPGPLTSAQVSAAKAATTTLSPMRWLYPYDQTVMPQGLPAALLQWADTITPAEVVYLRLTSKGYQYEGCFDAQAPGQLPIPQDVWEQAQASSGGHEDPLKIDLVTVQGVTPSKLPTRTLVFALGALQNVVYYSTYYSALATAAGVVGGVVMRVTPKEAQPELFLTATNTGPNCIGCHSVSADGSKLVAEEHLSPGLSEATGGIYDLTSGTLRPAPEHSRPRLGFSGLYPDGSVALTHGRASSGPFPGAGNMVSGTFGPETSKLIGTSDGMEASSTGAPMYALMPSFSTDGSLVAFNHLSDSGTGGHELSVMSFERSTNTFSNLRSAYTDASLFVGWPSFLPDVQGDEKPRAVFVLGNVGDYVTQDMLAGNTAHASDLHWIDLDSGMVAPLSRAGGFEGTTNVLPYGARDAHRDFYPSVSPVASGGYYWLFFSSRRQYGNELVHANESDPEGKKIWVAAIDVDAAPGTDPSHPAFYLPGQEAVSGNVRPVAALDACTVEGEACGSGIDCCSGFCIDELCAAPPQRCSELDEKCATEADCCSGQGLGCIGGFCSYSAPQ